MSVESVELQLMACPSVAAKETWVRTQAGAATCKISRRDLDRLQALIKDKKRPEAAALLLALAVSAGGNVLIPELRRRGLLRASRYGFQSGTLRELVRLLARLHDTLGLDPRWVGYLMSVEALLELAPEAKRLRDGLVTRLSQRRGKALKSFLLLADQAFALPRISDDEGEASPSGRVSAEDIASAVSRLIALTKDEVGLRLADFSYTDEQAINEFNGTYEQDLSTALRLEKLYDVETLVDGLPYRARTTGATIVVESIDPELEKSVRLGYVQTELQMLIRRVQIDKIWNNSSHAPVSLQEVFKRYYEDVISDFVEIKTHPLPRITFGIPDIANLFDPLASDRLYREDFLALLQLDVDDYEDFGLEPFEVAPGIDSIDLFKVNRLFALMAYLFQRELEKVSDPVERRRLALHSVIVAMRRDALLGLLGTVLAPEKAEKILDLLVLDETREFVDLQYTPFLKVENYFLLAPSLIAHSNLVRNIAFVNRLNVSRLDGGDPMQSAVAQALRTAGFLVAEEVEDSKRSSTGDTDLVAYRDGVLYLFECKNAYHPCNPHEMRNSYDHIRKAGTQLTLRQQKFGETAYREKIWKKLGWAVPAPTSIRTGVLIANRVFNGSRIGGHPVRQAHEFINVVERGVIRTPETVYRFWNGDALTIADLDSYLGSDGLLGDHFASMEPVQYRYAYGAKTLIMESWRFDLGKQHEIVQRRYPVAAETAT